VTLTPDPGTVTEVGSPLSSARLNHIEQGIFDAAATADEALSTAEDAKSSADASLKKASNLSDLANAASARTNIGLGNVPNYPVASQAQAEAGSDNATLMTPLRSKQYVDKRLLNNLQFRINSGAVEYWDGSGWNPMAAVKSVQRGVSSMTLPGPLDIPITAVDMSKSVVNMLFLHSDAGNSAMFININYQLTSSTNLRISQSGLNSGTLSMLSWEVIEYY